ncbi:class I SAM-dependent methyltransferase [Herminiimonas glaciei]|uniref:Class I SAM-dependent methyltransferase n=1 Tax=Herminiimonas glaciei TaxID=523788 RepID=A0ABW2IB05_9BURK
MHKDLHEANRLSWNAATRAHNSHKGDQALFFRNGGSTLFPEEQGLLGEVQGLKVLHLQCNSGQDSLSIARLGADLTGVDISDEAITFARELATGSGIAAHFERADVFDYLGSAAVPDRSFDLVFSSYGTICWLSDLTAWAQGIARVLKPGGRFVFVEFHPYAMVFDEQWRMHYDYFNSAPLAQDGVSDYVAESGDGLALGVYQAGEQDFANPHPSHEFTWGLGQVITALSQSGLAIARLDEYPYANGWKGFDDMQDSGGRRMVPPAGMPRIPLMYSIVAHKQ